MAEVHGVSHYKLIAYIMAIVLLMLVNASHGVFIQWNSKLALQLQWVSHGWAMREAHWTAHWPDRAAAEAAAVRRPLRALAASTAGFCSKHRCVTGAKPLQIPITIFFCLSCLFSHKNFISFNLRFGLSQQQAGKCHALCHISLEKILTNSGRSWKKALLSSWVVGLSYIMGCLALDVVTRED